MNKMSAGVLCSGPGSRVGSIISNDHKLSPTSLRSQVRTQYSPSDICPRLPGKLRGGRQDLIRFSSSRRQLESRANYRWWWPGHDCVSCPPPDWLMPQTFHQAAAKHWAWERGRVTPVNRCQAASDQTCVTLIPRLVHRKLSSPVSGMSKLSLYD